MTERHVAIGSDRHYLRHAGAAALSVLETTPGATVHLLHDPDVPAGDLVRFRSLAADAPGSVELHEVDPQRVADLPVMDRIGPVMWFRVLLPELLPDVPRVLYLDADTFVLDRLDPLLGMDLAGAPVAAATNVLEPSQRDRVAHLGVEQGYFNSGVLLLDLDRLRADGGMQRVLDVARRRRDELVWPDQDALNLVFAGGHAVLHPRWNTMNSLFLWSAWARQLLGPDAVDAAVQDPGILHFEGPGLKPWFRECPHPRVQEYRRLAARTPWGPLELGSAGPVGSRRDRARRRGRRAMQRLRGALGMHGGNRTGGGRTG